jgi:hypothetical protein
MSGVSSCNADFVEIIPLDAVFGDEVKQFELRKKTRAHAELI